MTFANAIRAARTRLNISQTEVAQRAGITQPQYSRIESGLRTTTPKTARAICAVLGLGCPLPAIAALEHLAEHEAQRRSITRAEAFAELLTDLKQITETGEDGEHFRAFETFDAAQAYAQQQ